MNYMQIKIKDWDRFSSLSSTFLLMRTTSISFVLTPKYSSHRLSKDDTCGDCVLDLRSLTPELEKNLVLDVRPQGRLYVRIQFLPSTE